MLRPWIYRRGTFGSWYVGWYDVSGRRRSKSCGEGDDGLLAAKKLQKAVREDWMLGNSSGLHHANFKIEVIGLDSVNKTGSWVYFLEAVGLERVKIGHTDDIETRFRKIQSFCPVRLNLLALISGNSTLEATLHANFAAFRIHGEWFQLSRKIQRYIQHARKRQDEISKATDPVPHVSLMATSGTTPIEP